MSKQQSPRLSYLYTRKELAKIFQVHPQTIDRWGKDGTLEITKIKGIVRFPQEGIEDLIKLKTRKSKIANE